MTSKIAIIGYGFVGKAVASGFPGHDLIIVDPGAGHDVKIRDLPDDLDFAFVCVPTPVDASSGLVDGSIVRAVVDGLVDRYGGAGDPVVVIKSTITPNHLNVLADQYQNLVFNPEFLTEANAIRDFQFPKFQVYGRGRDASPQASILLATLYGEESDIADSPEWFVDFETASMVKYAINSFLALKVTFFNEMNELVERVGGNWDKFRSIVAMDQRIGLSHTQVPGPDGKRGYGGSCFPKDTLALTAFGKLGKSPVETVASAIRVNNRIRGQYEVDAREALNGVDFKKEVA